MKTGTQYGLRTGALTVAALVLLGSSAAMADSKLAWKFTKGETTEYAIDRVEEILIDAGGVELAIDLQQAMDTTWEVTDVADDGTATVKLKVNRIQLKFNSPFTGPFEYDSKNPVEGAGPIWDQMGPAMEGLLNGEVTAKVATNGKVEEVTLSESMLEAFGGGEGGRGGRMASMMGAGMSADMVRNMIVEMVVLLPEESASEGDTWESELSTAMGPLGTMVATTTFTYAGTEDDLAKIDIVTEVEMQAAEGGDGDMEMELTEQESTGTVQFDAKAGRTKESVTKQKVVLEGFFMGNEFIQERTSTNTLKQGTNPDIVTPPAEEPAATSAN